MTNLVDLYIVYRILRLLTTPFTEWPAFKTGVIDAEGNILIPPKERRTQAQMESLTSFDVLMMNLKKVLMKLPFGKTKLATYAAALFLIKEEHNLTEENVKDMFLSKLNNNEDAISESLEKLFSKKNPPPMHLVIRNYYALSDRGWSEDEVIDYFNKTFGMKLGKYGISNQIAKELHKFVKENLEEMTSKLPYGSMLSEEIANVVGSGNIAGTQGDHPSAVKALIRRSKFANNDVFVVDQDRFMKARMGKRKFLRYEMYVGDDDVGEEIRQYGRKYPNKPVILQCEKTGAMCFLRYGKSGLFTESFDTKSKEITDKDLKEIEKYADSLFKAVNIDVNFTRHFLERVNDVRNIKQITHDELTALFRKTYKMYGTRIPKLGPDAEAVINDMQSNINLPFVLKWDAKSQELDLVAKTIMRKKNFLTPNKKLVVQ